jgi:hypothetical protein
MARCWAWQHNKSVLSNTMLLELANVICLARILVICSLLATLPYTSYSTFVAPRGKQASGLLHYCKSLTLVPTSSDQITTGDIQPFPGKETAICSKPSNSAHTQNQCSDI